MVQELQAWIDEQVTVHKEPETLRKILLIPYSTAIRRMARCKTANIIDKHALGKIDKEGLPPPSGTLEEKTLVFLIRNARFNWVICDKGHTAKTSCSVPNKLIRALDREALLIVSATPLLDHLRDFWGYVNLTWRHEWPFTHDGEGDPIPPETFYNEDAWDTIKRGEEFKKLGMGRLLGRVPESLDLMRHQEFAVQLSPREKKLRREYIAYVQGGHGPLYLLHPQLFQSIAKNMKYGAILAQAAVRPLMKLLCIHRGMLTRLELPDKGVVSPGDSLPMSTSRVERLRCTPSDARQTARLCERHFKNFISQSGELGSEHIGHNIFEGATSQVLNGAVLSVLSLLTTSQPNRRNTKLLGDTEAVKILAEQKLANFMQMNDTENEVGELKPVGGDLGSTGVQGTMTGFQYKVPSKRE